jgi:tyrosyl-tRNA synthetase
LASLGGLSANAAFLSAGLVTSLGDARRQVRGGGLKINDQTITDENRMLSPADLTPEGVIKLSFGKKKHVLLRAV